MIKQGLSYSSDWASFCKSNLLLFKLEFIRRRVTFVTVLSPTAHFNFSLSNSILLKLRYAHIKFFIRIDESEFLFIQVLLTFLLHIHNNVFLFLSFFILFRFLFFFNFLWQFLFLMLNYGNGFEMGCYVVVLMFFYFFYQDFRGVVYEFLFFFFLKRVYTC